MVASVDQQHRRVGPVAARNRQHAVVGGPGGTHGGRDVAASRPQVELYVAVAVHGGVGQLDLRCHGVTP